MSRVSLPASDPESLQKKRLDPRAAVPAALITLLLLGATLIVVFWFSDPASADSTAVYAGAEEGRLLLSFERVELSGEGSSGWGSLEPVRGERDTRDGPTRIAAGDPGEGPFTKARIVFDQAMAQRGEGLDSLHVPEHVVEIHVDDSGGPGDGLLIVFDAEKSVQDEEGVLSFRPAIIHASWVDGAAGEDKPVKVPQRWMPPLFSSAGSPDSLSNDPSPEDPADPDDGNDEDGGGSGGSGEGDSGSNDPPPDVGWLTVALIGNSTGLMKGLDVDVKRVALAGGEDPQTPMTRWAGDARVDLVETSESGEPGAVATVQVDAGEYSQLALEFGDATVWLHPDLEPEPAQVPQPFLGIESDFSVPPGEQVTATVRIGVEGSLRVGGEGYEFRPVVAGFAVEDELGNDLVARGPSQYRSGGPWLPLLGLKPEEQETQSLPDPYQAPHPVWGDKERPPWAEGSLRHVDPAHLEAFVEHFLVELGVRQTQQDLMETLESLTPKEDLEEAVDDLLPKETDPEDLVDEEPSLPESPV